MRPVFQAEPDKRRPLTIGIVQRNQLPEAHQPVRDGAVIDAQTPRHLLERHRLGQKPEELGHFRRKPETGNRAARQSCVQTTAIGAPKIRHCMIFISSLVQAAAGPCAMRAPRHRSRVSRMELRPEATDEGGKGGIFCVAVLPRSAVRDRLVRIEDNLGAKGAPQALGRLFFR